MSKKITVRLKFPIVIEDFGSRFGDNRWLASCPAIPGCVACGETSNEAYSELRKSIALKIALDYNIKP